jgi:predicted nucleotide-binding protein (sugar kinase/HSP70/actin superfamily)
MERDLNHYLRQGYSTPEVLAAVLHSVRENYLNKVAVESAIGDHVVFQGATARNEALVAAFEQRLERPVHVSPLCHLTGALGVALSLREESWRGSKFRGLGLYQQDIPIRPEVCDLCTNHCKLSVAEVGGDTVACGFLCGRDYETKKYVHNNRSGFDLFKTRKRVFRDGPQDGVPGDFTVGLPAALHLYEDLPFWRRFFRRLGVRVVASEKYPDGLKDGRLLAGAELCAPLTALHGHVAHLLGRCDLVFLPFYLERKPLEGNNRRQLCYLTQYAPILGAGIRAGQKVGNVLTPLVHSLRNPFLMKVQLARTLAPVLPGGASYLDVSAAFDEASRFKADGASMLREVYRREAPTDGDVHIVLLGRPYTVLSEWMNKNIPQIIESLGIRVFYQDMLSYGSEEFTALQPLLEELHWDYAARILEGAEVTARTPGAYPVLVTSFQCSPDSFVIDYFRQILDSHQKPYLVLQLDEHDSRLGYETRIEAAIRAFRNHHRSLPEHRSETTVDPGITVCELGVPGPESGLDPPLAEPPGLLLKKAGKSSLTGKTLLFPNWDSLSHRLVVAAARRKGLDARLLEPSEDTARRALRHNSGQCTPLNIIAQNFMEYVREHDLDPGESVLWMISSSIACNVRLYPHHIRTIFEAHGGGFERSGVYVGNLSLQDITPTLAFDTYLAYMFGGFLRKMGCAVRPYEAVAGDTDETIGWGIQHLERTFETDASKEEALAEVVSRLQAVRVEDTGLRPEVAIFGDLYTRDNDVLNQGLVRFIEAHGGQVITTPFTSFAKMVARPYYWKWIIEGNYLNVLSTKALMAALARLEKKYFRYFGRILQEPEPPLEDSPLEIFSEYNLRLEHTGESMENLLKIFYLTRQHPEVALFVQASPAFCCPAIVTEAMGREIESRTGVPVVSITYDGIGGAKNDAILPYLEYPRSRGGGMLRFRDA